MSRREASGTGLLADKITGSDMEPRYAYTMPDLLLRRGASDDLAIVDGDDRVTYRELLARAQRMAALLKASGVGRRDRVAIWLRRSARALVSMYAAQLLGAVAVFINDKLRAQQVNHIFGHSEASLLVTEAPLLRLAQGLAPDPARILDLDAVALPEDRVERGPAIAEDLALLIYTSGSTGLPKGIMLSHRNLLEGAYTVSDYLRLTAADRILSILPYSFDYGLNQATTAFLVGATLVVQRSMFPADICKTLLREEATGLAGVPMLWSQLAQPVSPFLKTQFPSLRYLTNSGGHFPEHLVAQFRRAHPRTELFLMYGLTEAFRSPYLPPAELDRRPGSMGKAIPNVEILVVDEQGRECAPGEPGELVHRGAHIAMGYWRDPEATARVYRPNPLLRDRHGRTETVVYSGDLVRRDEEGFLYFVGRRDQMIKSMGFRVSPEEIEHYVMASGLVAHVAAFAVPKGDVDTEIVVAVVPKAGDGTPAFDEEALLEHCRREMPEYMKPGRVWRVGELPQTTTGKPDRPRLRALYLAQ